MSDGADLLKLMTEKVVTYMEQPGKGEARRARRQRKEPWATRWFGQLLPVGIQLLWSARKHKGSRQETRSFGRDV